MKRIWHALAMVMTIALLLAGCGPQEATPGSSEANPPKVSQSTSAVSSDTEETGDSANGNIIDSADKGTGLNKISYLDGWDLCGEAGDYKGSHYYTWKNTLYQFEFEGTQFEIFGDMYDFGGVVQVKIDGKVAGTYDNYRQAHGYQLLLYKSPELENGKHKVQVINLVQKGGDGKSAGTCTSIDYIKLYK